MMMIMIFQIFLFPGSKPSSSSYQGGKAAQGEAGNSD